MISCSKLDEPWQYDASVHGTISDTTLMAKLIQT
jgi:hypothetical protein